MRHRRCGRCCTCVRTGLESEPSRVLAAVVSHRRLRQQHPSNLAMELCLVKYGSENDLPSTFPFSLIAGAALRTMYPAWLTRLPSE